MMLEAFLLVGTICLSGSISGCVGGSPDGHTTETGANSGSTSGDSPSDGGTSDGGTNDGGTSDGGTSDGGTSDGGTSDGGTSDGGTSDGGTSDGGTSDGGTSDGGTSDGGTSDGGTSDGGTSDGGTSDGGTSDGGTSDGGTSDGGTSDGDTSDGGTSDGGTADPAPVRNACAWPHSEEIVVSNASGLSSALSRAKPGTKIRLQPGRYSGRFKLASSGTKDRPIVLCGPRDSVLDGGNTGSGYVVHLNEANHWVLSGFTVTRGKKGVMLDKSSHNLLTGLLVHNIGEEAIHFRRTSTRNTLSYSEVRNTGTVNRGYGEGMYIGSAINHWSDSSTPDRSDYNQVLNNVFGPGIAAEHVDIKEGTTGGLVRGNQFDGRGIAGENYADSWIDLKGNGYRIEGNTGAHSPQDGFQLHVRVSGWGRDNVFSDNAAAVNGPGYGFWIDKKSSGNRVLCNNEVTGASAGYANVSCSR